MTNSAKRAIGVVALLVGLALIGMGLILGFGGITRINVDCGSGFGGVSRDALVADFTQAIAADANGTTLDQVGGVQAVCSAAVSDRKTTAWALTAPGIGVALVGAGFLIAGNPPKPGASGYKKPETGEPRPAA